jgi:hypothetical protein
MKKRLFLLSLLLLPVLAFAQDNRRCVMVRHGDILSDTLLIDGSSIWAADLGESEWSLLNKANNQYQVIFSKKQKKAVKMCYRVLPAVLSEMQRIEGMVRNDTLPKVHKSQVGRGIVARREQLFELGDINQGGRISRGISVGNTQDLFVNSALNLSLEGKLSEDLNIRASITDQNIPYQPEGNTQQLQDFDNVFVEIFNDKFSVAGGDIVLKDKKTHYLRYLKNVQGGMVTTNLKNARSFLGLSSAKGRFATVSLKVVEGISGPYQIPPPDGQGFVIIIANSEKVYLDGRLLTRGYNYDYVIDYNQAEISFTTNLMITRFSRVRVDFEYAVQDYARSIISVGHAQQMGKFTLSANYYKEEDNQNKALYRELTDDQKILLSEVGDSLDLAVVPGETQVEYSADRILYFKADTVDSQGRSHTIFKQAKSYMNEVFTIRFTDAGSGKGAYIVAEYVSQGRVYEWVGQNMGRYEPSVRLTAPNKKSMVTLGGRLKVSDHTEVYVETAFSDQDKNLFSDKDYEDNQGYAIKGGILIQDKPLGDNTGYSLNLTLDTEYLHKNFVGIDRFRRVEFDRDWSVVQAANSPSGDLLATAKIGLMKDALNQIAYEVQFRDKEGSINGFQHWLTLRKSLGKLQVNANGFSMNSISGDNSSEWRRVNLETYIRGKVQPGYRFATDRNIVRYIPSDTIITSANYFHSNEFFLRNAPAGAAKFELAYVIRTDEAPLGKEMNESSKSHFVAGRFNTLINNNHLVNIRLNYRVFADLANEASSVNSVSGRIDWTADIIKSVFRSELNYSVANARVARREYVFIEVATGEGTHTWRDENMDGVKDLNEFYEAINFDEKNYIKLYVPSSEFVDAFENIFNYRARLNFPRRWSALGGFKEFLAKISNTTAWASQYSTTEERIGARLIPFWSDLDPVEVLSMKESIRSTFFFNRTNPKFGASGGVLISQRKFLYTNGFEGRRDKEYNLTLRWNITRSHNIRIKSVTAERYSNSDYLEGRNYRIRDMKIGPSFSWQPKPTFRATGTYNVGLKTGLSNEQADNYSALNELIGELKLGSANRYMITATVKYSAVQFTGNELTPLGYELLQGLRPGDNMQWNVGWQQHLVNGLQIGVYYEGRKPEGVTVIHTGRASVSALF